MTISDTAKAIMAIVAVVTVSFSTFFFLENRYTLQETFFALEKRVSLNELRRQLRQAEEEAAYYRQLNRKYPNDQTIKDKLDAAERRVRELREEIRKSENV